MTNPEGVKPLMVFDVGDHDVYASTFHLVLLDWLKRERINPRYIYRIEVYLLDCPLARVFEYDRDEYGHLVAAGPFEVAHRPPYDVILSSLPPETPALPQEET